MALLDEDKLQGRVFEILELLRKESACCPIVTAMWMHDQSNISVWVLVYHDGTVVVKDSPTGNIQSSPALPLKP